MSRGAVSCAATGFALLGLTWYTKPRSYPPLSWSREALEFPWHIAAGLGPFSYYCPEKGRTCKLPNRRNLLAFPLNSVSSFQNRREVESTLLGELRRVAPEGVYYPLPGSLSQTGPPAPMDSLRQRGLVFEAPWTPEDLSLNCGRFWPDARGVFLVNEKLAVWINHEDHLQAVGEGADLFLQKLQLKFTNDTLREH